MTIICALHEPGIGTWIGSDTACSKDGLRRLDRGPKWTIVGSRAMGSAGSHLLANIIDEHSGELLNFDGTPFQLARKFRKLLTDYEFAPKEEGGEAPIYRSYVIYATADGVWHFTVDGGVYAIGGCKFCADGSGEDFAYGAAHFSLANHGSGKGTIIAALQAAIDLSDGCGGDPWLHLLPAQC